VHPDILREWIRQFEAEIFGDNKGETQVTETAQDTTLQEDDTQEWASGTMMERAKRFVEASKLRANLEHQLDRVKAELKTLADTLTEDFVTHDMQRARINGMTVYLQNQTWAKAPDVERAKKDLTEMGAGYLVKEQISTQSLSAWVRERIKQDEPVPESIELTEVVSLRARASS
jgi:transposase-like protein